MNKAYTYIFVLLFLIDGTAFAQNHDFKWKGYPVMQTYMAEQTGGHIQNWDTVTDSLGRIYVANNSGILRFDGKEWLEIDFPVNNVFEITKNESGRIYVGGSNEFGYLSDPSSADSYIPEYVSLSSAYADSISTGRITNLIAKGDELYLSSPYSVYLYQQGRFNRFPTEARVYDMFKRKDQVIVSLGTSGLYEITEDGLVRVDWGGILHDRFIFAYAQVGEQEVFCSYNECFTMINEEVKVFETEANALFSSYYIDEITAYKNESLLVATRQNGVVHLDLSGTVISHLTEETGLSNNIVYDVYTTEHGSAWLATQNGLTQIHYSYPILRYDERSGIDEVPRDLLYQEGNYYIVTTTGIQIVDPLTGLATSIKSGDGCSRIYRFNEELVLNCSQIYWVDNAGESTQILGNKSGIIAYPVEPDLFVYSSEDELGAIMIAGKRIEEYIIADFPLSEHEVQDVISDGYNVWVHSRGKGVLRFILHRGEEIRLEYDDIYLSDRFNKGSGDGINFAFIDQQVWFMTNKNGVFTFDEETGSMIPIEDYGTHLHQQNLSYYKASKDSGGSVWMSDGGSLFVLKPGDEEYIRENGFLSLINDQQFNDIYPDTMGYVWVSSDRGLIRYKKDHDYSYDRPFYTTINQVLVRNDSLINGGNNTEPDRLLYSDNELRFTYTGIHLDAPERTEYRVRLEGFEDHWSDWTLESQKDYTNIPEGDYTFKVQARNVYGVESESAGFSFSILPPWYRTWWAYLLYLISGGLILYTAYRIRVNQLLKVHRMRDRIASDLHDEVSATLSSISFFARAIEDRRGAEQKERFVKLIHESAGDAKEKITDIVWAINPEHDDWEAFLSKCRRYASDLLESKDIKYSLKIDESMPGKLDMEMRQNLWMIFKEMVTNAVRHSEAKQLDVIFTHEEGEIKLVVQDDGKGLDEQTIQKGNGLINIRKRAAQINGEIQLDSDAGFGTRWTLTVRV